MAEAAHAFLRLPWRVGLRRALAISPAGAHAIRFSVAVAAAIWIGKAPGLVENQATWILITVLMVMQPMTGGSLLKGLMRLVGTLAAALTSILLFWLFAQDPPLLMAALFFVQAVGAYGNSGSRFQYAWFVWAFTSAIVLGDAMAGQRAVETVAFQRGSMVAIGIVLVFVVDSLLWPARAEPRLRKSLASRARGLGDTLRRAVAASVDPPGADSHPPPESGILASQLGLVDAVRSELGVSRTTADALARMAMLLETLASRARLLASLIERPPDLDAEGRAFAAALSELARRIEAGLEEVAAALTVSRPPTHFSDELEQALLRVEAERDRWVRRHGSSAALEGRAADLRDLVAVLRTVEEALSSDEQPHATAPSRSLLHFRPDPFRTKIALRGGTAVIAAFVVPLTLGWPMNTLVAPIAFLFSSFNRGAGVQTMAMLAAIIALGWLVADLSIVYVAPYVGRAPVVGWGVGRDQLQVSPELVDSGFEGRRQVLERLAASHLAQIVEDPVELAHGCFDRHVVELLQERRDLTLDPLEPAGYGGKRRVAREGAYLARFFLRVVVDRDQEGSREQVGRFEACPHSRSDTPVDDL